MADTPSLPYDYARCMSPECQYAAQCLRNTPGRPFYQPYAKFEGGEDCKGLILPEPMPRNVINSYFAG